jgi:hypothetical protein
LQSARSGVLIRCRPQEQTQDDALVATGVRLTVDVACRRRCGTKGYVWVRHVPPDKISGLVRGLSRKLGQLTSYRMDLLVSEFHLFFKKNMVVGYSG